LEDYLATDIDLKAEEGKQNRTPRKSKEPVKRKERDEQAKLKRTSMSVGKSIASSRNHATTDNETVKSLNNGKLLRPKEIVSLKNGPDKLITRERKGDSYEK
jgi:hypothetical protein